MSKISRYRKSKPSDRRVTKRGTVTKTKRFSENPSKESYKSNKVIVKKNNKRGPYGTDFSLHCFEHWDLNGDGKLTEDDVQLWLDMGAKTIAQLLQAMIINQRFPQICDKRNEQELVSQRTDTISRTIMMRDNKKAGVKRTPNLLSKKIRRIKKRGDKA